MQGLEFFHATKLCFHNFCFKWLIIDRIRLLQQKQLVISIQTLEKVQKVKAPFTTELRNFNRET